MKSRHGNVVWVFDNYSAHDQMYNWIDQQNAKQPKYYVHIALPGPPACTWVWQLVDLGLGDWLAQMYLKLTKEALEKMKPEDLRRDECPLMDLINVRARVEQAIRSIHHDTKDKKTKLTMVDRTVIGGGYFPPILAAVRPPPGSGDTGHYIPAGPEKQRFTLRPETIIGELPRDKFNNVLGPEAWHAGPKARKPEEPATYWQWDDRPAEYEAMPDDQLVRLLQWCPDDSAVVDHAPAPAHAVPRHPGVIISGDLRGMIYEALGGDENAAEPFILQLRGMPAPMTTVMQFADRVVLETKQLFTNVYLDKELVGEPTASNFRLVRTLIEKDRERERAHRHSRR